MAKIGKYQKIIEELLEEYAAIKPAVSNDIDTELIIDRERNHFLLMHVGWRDKYPIYNTIIHIDIKDSKVWVQQDWTDAVIVDRLMEKGIPQDDIVLGFLAPYKRQYSGFPAS
ncbi:MAG: XisI protein [Phaeodactylibacter sp.]|nr:XisI protein [Phaeodactylibacter sp.]